MRLSQPELARCLALPICQYTCADVVSANLPLLLSLPSPPPPLHLPHLLRRPHIERARLRRRSRGSHGAPGSSTRDSEGQGGGCSRYRGRDWEQSRCREKAKGMEKGRGPRTSDYRPPGSRLPLPGGRWRVLMLVFTRSIAECNGSPHVSLFFFIFLLSLDF